MKCDVQFNLSCYYFFSLFLVTVCAGNVEVHALVKRRVGVGLFKLPVLLLTELLCDFMDVFRLFLATSD